MNERILTFSAVPVAAFLRVTVESGGHPLVLVAADQNRQRLAVPLDREGLSRSDSARLPSEGGGIISRDPRNVGAYAIAEAAHYLSLRPETLRTWVRGRTYPTARGRRRSAALIRLPDPYEPLLSFTNLVEAHVLKAIRRHHGVAMQKVRPALSYLERQLELEHPLAHEQLLTDGVHLFIKRFGKLVNLSQEGQLAVEELLKSHLQRIEHDAHGLALRLFPFSRGERIDVPRVVVVDPRISFGRPVIDGTSVRTEVVARRLKAGETLQELVEDYGIEVERIEEAIRYELEAA